MSRIRRRCGFLRTALLVLVALGVLWQPMLTALGDLHQVEHAVALHSDHGHAHPHGHEAPAGDDESPGDPIGSHGLLHPCGAAASMALLEPSPLLPAPGLVGDPPGSGYVPAQRAFPPTSPFRPPIA